MNTKKKGKEERKTPPTPHSPLATPQLDDWLEIGTIVAPQGIDGELRVYPNTDFPERFEVAGKRWLLRPDALKPQEVQLVRGRYLQGKGLYVIKLSGINNRNQAEELRESRLLVPSSWRPELGENEYHVMDLIGLEVFLQESGELVGTVVDVMTAGHDLLEVKLHQTQKPQTVLIPFVIAIAPVVDLQARRIEITPPAGLLDLK